MPKDTVNWRTFGLFAAIERGSAGGVAMTNGCGQREGAG
jgi:hypothetical protein